MKYYMKDKHNAVFFFVQLLQSVCVCVCVSACACVSEFWGFQGGVDKDSRLLAYDAWSMGDWILIFQGNAGPIRPWSLGHYIASKDWDLMTQWRTVITPKSKILNSVHSWFWHTTLYSWNGVICPKMTAAKCFNSVLGLHITVMECILLCPRNNQNNNHSMQHIVVMSDQSVVLVVYKLFYTNSYVSTVLLRVCSACRIFTAVIISLK
jgi:hypothetical protein